MTSSSSDFSGILSADSDRICSHGEIVAPLPPPQEMPHYTNSSLRMFKNFRKAILEHSRLSPSYAQLEEAYFSITSTRSDMQKPLAFSAASFSHQGYRPAMEDFHFYSIIDEGIIAGVFDGHRGKEVSQYVCETFSQKFAPLLRELKGDVYRTFLFLLKSIHFDVSSRPSWASMGTTAVVTFADKQKHMVYTATIGDSEANIYRKINNSPKPIFKSLPLSCIRNWKSKRDCERAAKAANDPSIITQFKLERDPKRIYFPFASGGLNLSRALGDVAAVVNGQPVISQKPKVTQAPVQTGDLLILSSDGLKDAVPESEIVALVEESFCSDTNLSEALVKHALHDHTAYDNISVIAIKIM